MKIPPPALKLPSLGLFLSIFLTPAVGWAEYDRLSITNAIEGQQATIRGIMQDIATRETAITRIEQHAATDEIAGEQLEEVLADLASAKATLVHIDGNNRKKVIIRLLFETVASVNESINVARTASTTLINKGVGAAAWAVTSDKMQGYSTEEAQRAMGIHPDQLYEARTVNIDACSNLASASLPELRQLQRSMGLSLDAMKGIIMNENPELGEVSDSLAILRKNEFVRSKIDDAASQISSVKAASQSATESDLPNVDDIRAEIEALHSDLEEAGAELQALNQQLKDLEATELLEEAQEQFRIYEDAPPLTATVPPDPPEDYEARRAAALRAEAQARWDSEGVPLVQTIETLKSGIETMWNNLMLTHETDMEPADPDQFIDDVLSNGPTSAGILTSPKSLSELSAENEEQLELIATVQADLPALLEVLSDLRDDFVLLQQEQTRLEELYDVVGGLAQTEPGESMHPVSGVSLADVTAKESVYTAWQELLPEAVTAATEQNDGLSDAYGASLAASTALFEELEGELDDSLSPPDEGSAILQRMIATAQSYQSLMEAHPLMAPVPDTTQNYYRSLGLQVFGYWASPPDHRDYHAGFTRVLDRGFSAIWYVENLASRLTEPDISAASAFEQTYRTLANSADHLCSDFMEARTELEDSYKHLESFTQGGTLMIADEFAAVTNAPGDHAVPPAPGDANARIRHLRDLYTVDFASNIDGTRWVYSPGAISVTNYGLPKLNSLPFVEVDESERALTVHRILEIRRDIATNANGAWLALPTEEFNAIFLAYQDELIVANSTPEAALRMDFPHHLGAFDATLVSAVSQGAGVAGIELQNALHTYHAAKSPPNLIGHSLSTYVSVVAGQTAPVTLTVNASGGVDYQWYVSQGNFGGSNYTGYDPVPGATTDSLTYTMDQDRDFYCRVSNPSGEVLTAPIHVRVIVTLPPVVWNGPTSMSGVVGVPFLWRLETNPTLDSMRMFGFDAGAEVDLETGLISPFGLTFDSANHVISGTPLVAGTHTFNVQGPVPDHASLFQEITITITEAPPADPPYDSWLAGFLDAEQLANPATTDKSASPANDRVSNLMKFALGLDPTRPAKGDDIIQCDTTDTATVTLSFVLGQAARDAGVTVTPVSSSGPNGPWAPLPPATLSESTIGGKTMISAEIEVTGPEHAFFRLEVSR